MRLYRFRADIPASMVILAVFAIQMATFFTVENLWIVTGVMLGLLVFSASPGSISHNHHHANTFTAPLLNRGYEVLMFLQTGVLPYAWTLHHNLGHHKHYLDQDLDPANWRMGNKLMSRVRYDLVNAALIYSHVCRIGRLNPSVYKRFKMWAVISLAVLSVFLFIDPVKALILFVVPMPIMYIGLLDNTFMQHYDLDTDSHYTASRNTTSRLYNLISWNLGYHTAHHIHPNVHWSQLPALHEQLQDQIPDGMKCNSVLLSACGYRHSRDANGLSGAPLTAEANISAAKCQELASGA